MGANEVIFYLLGLLSLIFGVLTVSSTRIFRTAIYLLFTLMSVAGIYFYFDFQFIAVVQIIVYVGGIVVLIIFSLFLTQHAGVNLSKPNIGKVIWSVLAALFGLGFTYNIIANNKFVPRNNGELEASVANIGRQLLSIDQYGYILSFEVISILLLAAMIGCIVVAMKEKEVAA